MDFVALSHLRWDFVFQRPQHLLSRCAREHRVFFWEEPVHTDAAEARVHLSKRDENIYVAVPELPHGVSESESFSIQARLLESLLEEHDATEYVLWYYTPVAMNFTRQLSPRAVVYDCMDELSSFRGAPPGLRDAEAELFRRADLVFTGGQSLFESKQGKHHSVHCFPSSIDIKHFGQGRIPQDDPEDQVSIPHPRIGFAGVIDERMDVELIASVADARPDWHFVMIGPVVKIAPADLPQRPNIHYLGGKKYTELPAYMGGWEVAMLPFAINEATRFISPTKTPEYLAAGRVVVSTAIRDVVRPYGELGLVEIVTSAEEFVTTVEKFLQPRNPDEEQARINAVDAFLSRSSWDTTWRRMHTLIDKLVEDRAGATGAPATAEPIAGISAD